METLDLIDRLEDRADCLEKAMFYKWQRAVEYMHGGQYE